MMNEYIGADVTEALHEEQWLTQLQETARKGSERAVGSSAITSAGASAAASISQVSIEAAAKDSLSSGTAVAAAAAVADASRGTTTGLAIQQTKTTWIGGDGVGNRKRLSRRLLAAVTARLPCRWPCVWQHLCGHLSLCDLAAASCV